MNLYDNSLFTCNSGSQMNVLWGPPFVFRCHGTTLGSESCQHRYLEPHSNLVWTVLSYNLSLRVVNLRHDTRQKRSNSMLSAAHSSMEHPVVPWNHCITHSTEEVSFCFKFLLLFQLEVKNSRGWMTEQTTAIFSLVLLNIAADKDSDQCRLCSSQLQCWGLVNYL